MNKVLLFLFFISSFSYAQQSLSEVDSLIEVGKIDSLMGEINNLGHDSIKIKALIIWGDSIYKKNPTFAKDLNLIVDSLCTINLKKDLSSKDKKKYLAQKANALFFIGRFHYKKYENPKALEYLLSSLKIGEQINDTSIISRPLITIGNIYKTTSNINKALEYFDKSLKLGEKTRDKKRIDFYLNKI
jgi:tetratricopeptide (TPR) repeat protein